jgi:hypothetical protein
MKHTIRLKRHFIRDITAFISGGALIAAITQRSVTSLILAVLNGGLLFLEERADIEEEESE